MSLLSRKNFANLITWIFLPRDGVLQEKRLCVGPITFI